MTFKAMLLWILGLVTVVPYSIYNLLFHAQREDYAFLITLALFWIFGYWSLAGPVIMLSKIRSFHKSLETVRSREEFEELLHTSNTREVAIDLIASENKIPRFLAKRIYGKAVDGFSKK